MRSLPIPLPRPYGLIDGSGDELRLSDDAVIALAAPNEDERRNARYRLALKPSLFQDLRKDFPDTLPSEDNIRFWLIQRQFTQEAAGKAAKNYLSTMRLAAGESVSYNQTPEGADEQDEDDVTPDTTLSEVKTKRPPVKAGMLEEVFNLDEGAVTLTFPDSLSSGGYQYLADHLEIFLRKAKRRAEKGE